MPEHLSPRRPVFKISLSERPGKHILERTPRYQIMVNGEEFGELYYNMRGYVGYLPTVRGAKMDIGERGISAFRREVRALNAEAEALIERSASDPQRLVLTRPTEDARLLLGMSRHVGTGAETFHLISRRELLEAERLFGTREVGIGFFSEEPLDPETMPGVLVHETDEGLVERLGRTPVRMMSPEEAEAHERSVERVVKTEDPDVLVVVTRRIVDLADPEPEFVSKWGYDIAKARYGDGVRMSDLERVDCRPAVPDPADRAYLRANFTWLDVAEPKSSEPGQVVGPA